MSGRLFGASVAGGISAYTAGAGVSFAGNAIALDLSAYSISASPDTDTLHVFGRHALGVAMASDYATWSHYDQRASATGWGVAQSTAGLLYLNTPTGQGIRFSINAVAKWWVGSGGDLYPDADAGVDVGTSSARVKAVYAREVINNYSAIGETTVIGIYLTNSTAAANGAQQYAPRIRFTAQGWKSDATAASETCTAELAFQTTQGTAHCTANYNINVVGGDGVSRMFNFASSGDFSAPGLSSSSYVSGVTFAATGAMVFTEMTEPAGDTNKATIYACDGGGGKTSLRVIFQSGTALVIKDEA